MPGKITNELVANAKTPKGIHRDGPDGVPGFILRVGKKTRSFAVRIEQSRNGKKLRAQNLFLGNWPAVKLAEARKLARHARADHERGKVIKTPSGGPTIDSAWEDFKTAPRKDGHKKSAATIAAYQSALNRLSESIRQTPLRDLSDLMEDEIARIVKVHGQVAANMTTRFLKALYNRAKSRATGKSLPTTNPMATVDIINPGKEQKVLKPKDMKRWNEERLAITNEVRREAHLFTLLSGLRANSVETLEWEHLNVRERSFHIPTPKGGSRKAFDLILTLPMIACLNRARRAGRRLYPEHAARWVFPGESEAGTIKALTKDPISFANHALRRGYGSAATAAGVEKATVKRFLNHGKGDVTDGYILRSATGQFMAGEQGKISRAIMVAIST
jgi:integrase